MEKYVIFQGKKIAYQVSGSGRSIVLLHGFLEDRSIWDQFSETLSPHYQIVTVDLPGFGQSENLSDVHTMALMAEAVNEVLVAEDIKHCILVGHSMGGYVAIELAAKFSDKLSGLVFFHSHVAADGDEARINRYRAIEIVKNNKKQFISSFIPLLFAEKNINRFAKEIARLQQRSDAISAESVMASLAGMAVRNDRQELLGNLEIPVLFIIGKQDSRIPMDKIMPQVQLPRHSEAIILSEVGHMGFLEEKEKTCTVLANFAARIL
jgi:pimeloyl-ACP methyl ester carboxylesterase